jgi:hypothetical protein
LIIFKIRVIFYNDFPALDFLLKLEIPVFYIFQVYLMRHFAFLAIQKLFVSMITATKRSLTILDGFGEVKVDKVVHGFVRLLWEVNELGWSFGEYLGFLVVREYLGFLVEGGHVNAGADDYFLWGVGRFFSVSGH